MKKFIRSSKIRAYWVFITVITILPLIVLTYFYYKNGGTDALKLLEFAILIYGTFVATLLGVYISLYFSTKQEHDRERKSGQQTMLGSLKVIWSELDINEDILKNLHKGLIEIPKNPTQLYAQQSYLIQYAKGLKYFAFYSTMSSGAINIISTHNNIFNDLQQAYYNTELTQNGMYLSNETYKDFIDKDFVERNQDLVSNAFKVLNAEIKKIERTISMVSKAKKTIFGYLTKKGVTFTKEEEKKQKDSNKKSKV